MDIATIAIIGIAIITGVVLIFGALKLSEE